MHRSLFFVVVLSCIFTSSAHEEITRNCPADITIQTVTLTDKADSPLTSGIIVRSKID